MRDKVGFFDSGVGGTCILKAFRRLCPGVPTEYIADSKNCPYGNKPPEEIIRLSEANVKKLLKKGCKVIVVACNTATAAAIDYLRAKYPEVPFVGIEPAVKPAALRSKTGVVAVLATQGTFNGRLYRETSARFAKNVTVLATVADEFVTAVEKAARRGSAALNGQDACSPMNGQGTSSPMKGGAVEIDERRLLSKANEAMVRAKIEPLIGAGADHIVLGCTHFPHLKPLIEKVAAGRATVIDPSAAVALQAKRVWELTCG